MLAKPKTIPPLDVILLKTTDDHVPTFYHHFHCSSTDVCQTLVPEIDCWTPENPVLIVAPPGTGKTTFCTKELIPRALAEGKNIMVISNRVALSTQQKMTIMKVIDSPLIEMLTDKGVRETENFGSVCVLTYHRLDAFLNDPANQKWLENVMYVVCDEIHMVTSDAGFNAYCGHYLKLLTERFCHAIRVYMTATPWDILYPLAEAEKNNYRSSRFLHPFYTESRSFIFYEFPSDYSHVDLKFFEELADLKPLILAAPDRKWVVFVDSKAKGKAFAEDLGDCSLYLDADAKDTPEWNEIIKTSTFPQQVLVTTAALDCGLNLHDPTLDSVAIITCDRVSLLQMLGRKRREPGERIHLYVCDPGSRKISERYQRSLQLQKWEARYDKAAGEIRRNMLGEIWQDPDSQLRLYFRCINGYLVPNRIAFFVLARRVQFYERILNKEITFRGVVHEWLNIPEDFAASPQGQLTTFCETNCGIELTEDQIVQCRELIITAAKQNGFVEPQPSRLKTLGREALNNRLETFEFEYRLAKNAWIIERTELN